MGVVKIKDTTFETSISESQIKQRLKELGSQISADLKDDNPLFMAVLNGSFIFAADLLREVTIPCEVTFVKVASYEGTASTGKVKQLIGVNQDLTGRTVVIVEDIIESGLTMRSILNELHNRHAERVLICTLTMKPDRLQEQLDINYVAFTIPNDFIVGYGLDYDQQGRQLKEIYKVKTDNE